MRRETRDPRKRTGTRRVPHERHRRSHLADVRGWLDERDPFFRTMAQIVEERLAHRPLLMKKLKKR